MSNSNPVSRIRARTHAQLAEHAAAIRKLNKRTIEDVIAIGQHLFAAKALAGHGHWLPWLRQELGWASESSALRFMHVAELAKSVSLTDLNIDLSALYRLASPSTPSEVVERVVALGRRITDEDVAARMTEYEVVDEEPAQAQEISYARVGFEGDAEQARRSRYGDVRQVYAYRQEVEEQPVRQVRFQVETTSERVIVPYYVPAQPQKPRTIEDFQKDRIRSTAEAILRHWDAIARGLAEHRDIGEIVRALTNEERAQFRQGIEPVDALRAAWDESETDVEVPDQLN
jgi:hypothetical protein